MNATPQTGRGLDDHAHGTLGALLYSGRTAEPPQEKEWTGIVRSMAAGDQLALRELYARSYRLVFTLAMRITSARETAEELTVDVFYEAWRRAPRYDPADGTVVGWLMNLARSRAIDRLRFEQRKKRTDPRRETATTAHHENGAEQPLLEAERSSQVRKALDILSATERQAIEVAYFQGLTHAETAARLGEPLGTVKTRIRSGLQKLRTAFALESASP